MNPARPIYLDAHATTPVDPRVLDAMLPYFHEKFGNAASRNHAYGWEASAAVEKAREEVATAIAAEPKEIVWTSGATEADNLALWGAAEMAPKGLNHLIVGATEHQAVLDSARALEDRGFRVTRVPVETSGIINLEALAAALSADTFLVSIMLANNEIGTIQPIAEIAAVVHAKTKALVHTDAVQALGRIPVDVQALGVDLLSLSAHKVYGPKGVGALYVRRRHPTVRLAPLIHGGGHERGMRSGTLNVPGIVGMGRAFAFAQAEREASAAGMRVLRDLLHQRLTEPLRGVHLNGHPTLRLPNNLHLSFDGVEAEELMRETPEIAVSTGAACSSASLEASHVLRALGLPESRAVTSIRFGLTRWTTEDEVETAARCVVRSVKKLRADAVAD